MAAHDSLAASPPARRIHSAFSEPLPPSHRDTDWMVASIHSGWRREALDQRCACVASSPGAPQWRILGHLGIAQGLLLIKPAVENCILHLSPQHSISRTTAWMAAKHAWRSSSRSGERAAKGVSSSQSRQGGGGCGWSVNVSIGPGPVSLFFHVMSPITLNQNNALRPPPFPNYSQSQSTDGRRHDGLSSCSYRLALMHIHKPFSMDNTILRDTRWPRIIDKSTPRPSLPRWRLSIGRPMRNTPFPFHRSREACHCRASFRLELSSG
ncbi:predicted protein [Plenodomus lingam JN3]|uniref:Predicted protein n=1 Tax=Leptosphaeria maculans (strain JN3 / isolate v23.1.3 / race Av1-4-5-6-7-8) TaxID=985895 RepID=E5AAK3_LEPMJ|nr:predicted protein [Plenodomus lingam JN3]CBY00694.1 predicted protein [Plenodomus lingam JN3]